MMIDTCMKIIKEAQENTSTLPLAVHFNENIYHEIKLKVTKFDNTLLNVIWPGVRVLQEFANNFEEELEDVYDFAIDAPDFETYVVFEDLVAPLVKDKHNLGGQIPLHSHSKPMIHKHNNIANQVEFVHRMDLAHTNGGIVAPDFESYMVFENVMIPIVKEIHGIQKLASHPQSQFFKNDRENELKTKEKVEDKQIAVKKEKKKNLSQSEEDEVSNLELTQNANTYKIRNSKSFDVIKNEKTQSKELKQNVHSLLSDAENKTDAEDEEKDSEEERDEEISRENEQKAILLSMARVKAMSGADDQNIEETEDNEIEEGEKNENIAVDEADTQHTNDENPGTNTHTETKKEINTGKKHQRKMSVAALAIDPVSHIGINTAKQLNKHLEGNETAKENEVEKENEFTEEDKVEEDGDIDEEEQTVIREILERVKNQGKDNDTRSEINESGDEIESSDSDKEEENRHYKMNKTQRLREELISKQLDKNLSKTLDDDEEEEVLTLPVKTVTGIKEDLSEAEDNEDQKVIREMMKRAMTDNSNTSDDRESEVDGKTDDEEGEDQRPYKSTKTQRLREEYIKKQLAEGEKILLNKKKFQNEELKSKSESEDEMEINKRSEQNQNIKPNKLVKSQSENFLLKRQVGITNTKVLKQDSESEDEKDNRPYRMTKTQRLREALLEKTDNKDNETTDEEKDDENADDDDEQSAIRKSMMRAIRHSSIRSLNTEDSQSEEMKNRIKPSSSFKKKIKNLISKDKEEEIPKEAEKGGMFRGFTRRVKKLINRDREDGTDHEGPKQEQEQKRPKAPLKNYDTDDNENDSEIDRTHTATMRKVDLHQPDIVTNLPYRVTRTQKLREAQKKKLEEDARKEERRLEREKEQWVGKSKEINILVIDHGDGEENESGDPSKQNSTDDDDNDDDDDESAMSQKNDLFEMNSTLDVMDLDSSNKFIVSAKIECTRNLENYNLPKNLCLEELKTIETKFKNALKHQSLTSSSDVIVNEETVEGFNKGDEDAEQYYSVQEVLTDPSPVRTKLAATGQLIALIEETGSYHCSLLHGKYWPQHRGVYISRSELVAAWINVLEHLRIISCTSLESPGKLGEAYARLAHLVICLDKNLKPKRCDKLGFITSRPSCLGNTIRFQVVIRLPQLIKQRPVFLEEFCNNHGLMLLKCHDSDTTCDLRNRRSLGETEYETYSHFAESIITLIQSEKQLIKDKFQHVNVILKNLLMNKNLTKPDAQLKEND